MAVRPLKWVVRVLAIAGLVSLLLVPAAAAWAQTSGGSDYPSPSTPTTLDPCPGKGLPVIGQVNGVDICGTVNVSAATSSSALAFTGADIAELVGLAFVIVAAGVVLVRMGRRPQAAR